MNFLIVGEACQDVFIYGKAERLSPEAPCPVFVPSRQTVNAGMGLNVLNNLESLSGGTVQIISQRPNLISKTRYVDEVSNYILFRVDQNDSITNPLTMLEFRRRLKQQGDELCDFDAVVISDYSKGFLTAEFLQELSIECVAAATPIYIDTKKILGPWSEKFTYVKINEVEYKRNFANHGTKLFCHNLITTLGGQGMRWFSDDGTCLDSSGLRVEVRDVAGAGDVVLAALATALTEGKGPQEAMRFANRAAGIAVSKRGVVVVKRAEVENS